MRPKIRISESCGVEKYTQQLYRTDANLDSKKFRNQESLADLNLNVGREQHEMSKMRPKSESLKEVMQNNANNRSLKTNFDPQKFRVVELRVPWIKLSKRSIWITSSFSIKFLTCCGDAI